MGKDPGGETSAPYLSFEVQLVEILPDGPVIWLRDLIRRPASAPQHSFFVGSSEDNDIVIRGNTQVADTHCILLWTSRGLEARGFASGKKIEFNDVELVDGHVLLKPHNVLAIGGKSQVTRILVHGRRPQRRPQIPARDYPEFVLKAHDYLGENHSMVAETIGLKRRTYKRRLAEFGALLAVVIAFAVGGFWLTDSNTTDKQRDSAAEMEEAPSVIAPAAATPTLTPARDSKSPPQIKPTSPSTVRTTQERKAKPAKKQTRARRGAPKATAAQKTTAAPRAEPTEQPQSLGVFDESQVGARGVHASEPEQEDEK